MTIGAAAPLAAYVRSEQRAARVRDLLRLASPGGSQRPVIGLIVLLAVLAGIGAAQPVLEETKQETARNDVQAFFIIDTSRSMLASAGPGGATRFERARDAALRFRDALEVVPVGLASITDRVLPLVFPTANRETFESTLRLALGVDRPASSEAGDVRATKFGALSAVGNRNFFRGPGQRLAVLFTDAESTSFDATGIARSLADGDVRLLVVRIGRSGELVYGPGGAPEPYEPDPSSAAAAERLASAAGGEAFAEDELASAVDAARQVIGEGRAPTIRSEQTDVRPLAPYVFLLALLPLGFLLYRRNLA